MDPRNIFRDNNNPESSCHKEPRRAHQAAHCKNLPRTVRCSPHPAEAMISQHWGPNGRPNQSLFGGVVIASLTALI